MNEVRSILKDMNNIYWNPITFGLTKKNFKFLNGWLAERSVINEVIDDTIARNSQDIYDVQETLESMETNLQRRNPNKSKTPPGTNVRQPDIVPLDIMDTMKTATTSKRKLDNTDINKFGDRPL